MKPCPFCSELIQDKAVKCRFCDEYILSEEEEFSRFTRQREKQVGITEKSAKPIKRSSHSIAGRRGLKKAKRGTNSDLRKLVLLAIPILAILALLIVVNSKPNPPKVPQTIPPNPATIPYSEASAPTETNTSARSKLRYEVVKEQDYSYENYPRMIYRIVLSTDELPLDVDVRSMITEFCKSRIKGWKEITAFVYLPGMNTEGQAYAAAEYLPSGLKSYKAFPESLIGTAWERKAEERGDTIGRVAARERQKLEARVGKVALSLDMKKKIYREFVNDPLWAKDDGTDRVVLQLGEKYMKRYDLTREQLALICAEGSEKAW